MPQTAVAPVLGMRVQLIMESCARQLQQPLSWPQAKQATSKHAMRDAAMALIVHQVACRKGLAGSAETQCFAGNVTYASGRMHTRRGGRSTTRRSERL